MYRSELNALKISITAALAKATDPETKAHLEASRDEIDYRRTRRRRIAVGFYCTEPCTSAPEQCETGIKLLLVLSFGLAFALNCER